MATIITMATIIIRTVTMGITIIVTSMGTTGTIAPPPPYRHKGGEVRAWRDAIADFVRLAEA
jgi:hypothetical protein